MNSTNVVVVSGSWTMSRPVAIRTPLRELHLVADVTVDLDVSNLTKEFPSLVVAHVPAPAPADFVVDELAWRGAFDLRSFDERVERERPLSIAVRGVDAVGVAMEVVGRYQHLLPRRSAASASPLFDAVLDLHAAVFEGRDMERWYALDTWQWLLRLDPRAGLAAEVASLFHEIDRLDDAPMDRLEHRAHRRSLPPLPDRGRSRLLARLRDVGLVDEDLAQVQELLVGCALPAAEVLDDADGLSFLSLMSDAYVDAFGGPQSRRKLAFTVGRMSLGARAKIASLRLRPDVDRLLRAEGGARGVGLV